MMSMLPVVVLVVVLVLVGGLGAAGSVLVGAFVGELVGLLLLLLLLAVVVVGNEVDGWISIGAVFAGVSVAAVRCVSSALFVWVVGTAVAVEELTEVVELLSRDDEAPLLLLFVPFRVMITGNTIRIATTRERITKNKARCDCRRRRCCFCCCTSSFLHSDSSQGCSIVYNYTIQYNTIMWVE